MKKILASLVCLLTAIGLTGCKVTPDQIKVIAQNAGMGAAVTWIAYDNPSQPEKEAVKAVLKLIQTNAANVQSGSSYSAALFPIVENYVSTANSIPVNYKPLVLTGSAAALNGIDLLFAMNPSWKSNATVAVEVVDAFVMGANQGLSLTDRDPLIIQAKQMNTVRAKAKSKAL